MGLHQEADASITIEEPDEEISSGLLIAHQFMRGRVTEREMLTVLHLARSHH